jgi:hypothetical protein
VDDHVEQYQAPAVEERVDADAPLSVVQVNSDGGQPQQTPVWRRRP